MEQQTATSEILGVIASSPTDIQPVLDAIAENAARVLQSHSDAVIRLLDGNVFRLAAQLWFAVEPRMRSGKTPGCAGWQGCPRGQDNSHSRHSGRCREVPERTEPVDPDMRTFLATPLLREGTAIGVINIRRTEVSPFTEKQVALLETLPPKLLSQSRTCGYSRELQDRNAELREALEHQTATSEVLGIISRSPTDVQPVLDAIVESAAKVCGIDDVKSCRLRDDGGWAWLRELILVLYPLLAPRSVLVSHRSRWMREHGTLHVPDVHAQNDFPMLVTSGPPGVRS